MQLTPGVTIERGDIVSRQTIYDLVRLAVIGTVQQSDMAGNTLTIVSQSLPPSTPGPGTLWWDMTSQLAKVWTDMLDGTTVSLWLAIGPDRFDTAVLATEPIPFGAACEAAYGGVRTVKLPPHPTTVNALGYTAGRFENMRVIGFNQSTLHGAGGTLTVPTAQSGAWLALGIAGIVRIWSPWYHITTGFGVRPSLMAGLISMYSGTTGASDGDGRGGVMFDARGDGSIVASASFLGHPLWDVKNASQPSGFLMDAWGKMTFFGPVWQ
jgi:hypothetical protein